MQNILKKMICKAIPELTFTVVVDPFFNFFCYLEEELRNSQQTSVKRRRECSVSLPVTASWCSLHVKQITYNKFYWFYKANWHEHRVLWPHEEVTGKFLSWGTQLISIHNFARPVPCLRQWVKKKVSGDKDHLIKICQFNVERIKSFSCQFYWSCECKPLLLQVCLAPASRHSFMLSNE